MGTAEVRGVVDKQCFHTPIFTFMPLPHSRTFASTAHHTLKVTLNEDIYTCQVRTHPHEHFKHRTRLYPYPSDPNRSSFVHTLLFQQIPVHLFPSFPNAPYV